MALILHPTYELYEKKHVPFCSSLQVAEAFEKQHKHVLEDIAKIGQPKSRPSSEKGLLKFEESSEAGQFKLEPVDTVADFFKDNFKRTTYINKQNKKQPMYLMTKDGFTLLVMGYTGEKAMRFKIAFIKRFNEMEQFIRAHLLASDDFPPFTQAVKDAHDEPQSYHYSNEINLIYRIALGMDAKQFRETHGLTEGESIRPYLSDVQYKAVRKLQTEDIRLLYKGADYDTRKQVLTVLFLNRYAEALRA